MCLTENASAVGGVQRVGICTREEVIGGGETGPCCGIPSGICPFPSIARGDDRGLGALGVAKPRVTTLNAASA